MVPTRNRLVKVLMSWINAKEKLCERKFLQILLWLVIGLILKVSLAFVYYSLSLTNFEASIRIPVPAVMIVLVMCFIRPLFEEILYRLPLTFNISYVRISSILFLVETFFLYEVNRFFLAAGPDFLTRVMLFLLVSTILIYLLFQAPVIEKLQSIWSNRFLSVIAISQTIFGLAHLNKFDSFHGEYLYPVVVVFAYFMIGIYYSIVRMKLGIGMSIFYHILFNSSLLFSFLDDGLL
jgi:hypothetical protein